MNSNRVADAASISPYPFVVRQGHRQPPATSDDADRGTPVKGKKLKGRPKTERNPRQEEEPRFNVGPPRNNRNPQNNRGVRRVFRMPGRWYQDDGNGVPDYPPPSFQEAITTPPMSVCSSTTSLPIAPLSVPLVIPDTIPSRATVDDSQEHAGQPDPAASEENTATDAEVNFEGDMFVIDKNTVPFSSSDLPKGPELEARIKRDWLERRGVEFPSKDKNAAHSKVRLRLQIDPDPVNEHLQPSPSPPISPKRRFLSLSPLKTIFPPKSPTQQERATLSAYPSPSQSPYSSPSRSAFFRSSSSLATASFLKLPLLTSASQRKSESLSRKIFKGKEKEKGRAQDADWEVVDEDAYEDVDEDGNVKSEPPCSLMSAVESIQVNPPAGSSPTKAQVLIFSDNPSLRAKQNNTVTEANDTEIHTHFLSRGSVDSGLKDWKNQPVPFVDRPVNRGRSSESPVHYNGGIVNTQTALVNSTHILSTNSSSTDTGPPLTTVRVRTTSPSPNHSTAVMKPTHTAQVAHPSPLRAAARPTGDFIENERAAAMYQRALDTPLPSTPQFYGTAESGGSVAALNLDEGGVDLPSILSSVRSSPARSVHSISARDVRPLASQTSLALSVSMHPSLSLAGHSSISDLPLPEEHKEPVTPSRHHYAGRPLPRPPPRTSRAAVVDSTYAAPDDAVFNPDKSSGSLSTCPEGLLIDLEDTSLDTIPGSECNTPTDEGFFQHPERLVPVSQASSSSVNLLAETSYSLYADSDSTQGTSMRSRSTSSGLVGDTPQNNTVSEFTDLDLLVSRVSEVEHDNSDYEVSPRNTGWTKSSLNKVPDASSGLRDTWAREPYPILSNHASLPGSQSQRQYFAHWAY